MIRLIFVVLFLLLFCVYTIIVYIPLLIIKKINKHFSFKISFFTLKFIAKIVLMISGISPKIIGIENIDKGPSLIIANHRGFYDVITALTFLKSETVFVAKKEFEKFPILHFWTKMINCYFLDRKDLRSGMNMILYSVNFINDGYSVFIFPEGTRNKNSDIKQLLDFKGGVFKIAEKTNCKILPIAFLNTDKVFENNKCLIKKANVKISIGKPYYIDIVGNDETIAEYSRNIIINQINEME